jgi:hypothetical protein
VAAGHLHAALAGLRTQLIQPRLAKRGGGIELGSRKQIL